MDEISGLVFMLNTAGNTIAQQEIIIGNLRNAQQQLQEKLNSYEASASES